MHRHPLRLFLTIAFLTAIGSVVLGCSPKGGGSDAPPLSIPASLPRGEDTKTEAQGDPCYNVTCGDGLECVEGLCMPIKTENETVSEEKAVPNHPPIIEIVPPPASGSTPVTINAYDPDQGDTVHLRFDSLPPDAQVQVSPESNPVQATVLLPTPLAEGHNFIVFAENRDDNGLVVAASNITYPAGATPLVAPVITQPPTLPASTMMPTISTDARTILSSGSQRNRAIVPSQEIVNALRQSFRGSASPARR
ncbi:MAG: hypothetical protein HYS22_05130 [Deltaproteobacteria bacterium]|nr:hypothetical protein [Deltaproteobacteria bacterium]